MVLSLILASFIITLFLIVGGSFRIGWKMCKSKFEKDFFFSGSCLTPKKVFSPFPTQIISSGNVPIQTTQPPPVIGHAASEDVAEIVEKRLQSSENKFSRNEILVSELEKEIALKTVLLEDAEAKNNETATQLGQVNIKLEDALFLIQKIEIAFGKEVINSILTHEANSKLAGLSNVLEIERTIFDEDSSFDVSKEESFDELVFHDDIHEKQLVKVDDEINSFDDEQLITEQAFTFSSDFAQNGFTVSSNEDLIDVDVTKSEDFDRDELEKLRGIGFATKRKLNELGFFTFKQIVSWSDDKQEFVAKRLIKFEKKREKWIHEAKNAHFEKYGERL